MTDLTPLTRLGGTLEELSFQAVAGTTIDLASFPHLRKIAGYWDEMRSTFYAPEYLQEVILFDYDGFDLEPLSVQPSLQTIQLKVARNLETLEGIAAFPTLAELSIAARDLHALDAVESVAATLRKLVLEDCRDVGNIQDLSNLTELRFLGINNSGQVSTLQPVSELVLLEQLYAWGSTRIEDGDLSPLLRLPHLREVRMRDRREYRPGLAEIKARLVSA